MENPYELMNLYTRSGKKITVIDRILDLMPRGVYIVTTSYQGQINGMTAAMLTRVSATPIYVMVAVWHQNYSNKLIKNAGCFAINILREENIDLAKHFGRQSGRDVNKFNRQDIYWDEKKTGSPILFDALAYIDCNLIDLYEPPRGDHTIFIGEVLEADYLQEGHVLLYNRADYPYRVLKVTE
jgi:flavin reductase (DIM6/NTAB) family NADH-FMN oxidoreductase RutF